VPGVAIAVGSASGDALGAVCALGELGVLTSAPGRRDRAKCGDTRTHAHENVLARRAAARASRGSNTLGPSDRTLGAATNASLRSAAAVGRSAT
jgi:hypothetical protein